MLKLSCKSVYHLLEQHYQRRSLNQLVFGDTIPDNIFESSKVIAIALEDYDYMSVMVTNKDDLDKKYVLFIDGMDAKALPIVFEKDKEFTLVEAAIISLKCKRINVKLFFDIIEAQAEGKQKDPELCISIFTAVRKHFIKAIQ